jgi:diguanylate cyclase (GGDEF)-like protein/PAS domain S-box-containing protein
VPNEPCPRAAPRPALDRLARLAARATGAHAGAVTLLDGDVLEVAGRHRQADRAAPCQACVRAVASRAVATTGDGSLAAPVLGADGAVAGAVCVFAADRAWTASDAFLLEDVAASVRAELELRAAADIASREQRVGAAVLDAATDCLIGLDGAGRVTSWSPSAERTFGYTAGEAAGRPLTVLLAPPGRRESYAAGLRDMLHATERERRRVEVVVVHRDGREMPVEFSLVAAGEDGHVAGVRDLTDLRAVQARLELAERSFRALVEQMPAVTYTCDYDRGGLIHYVSPQIEELTGLPAEHFLGDPATWDAIVHPDDRARVAEQLAATLAQEIPFEAEYRVVARDGAVRWVWERETIVRDAAGRAVHGQGVIVDLTPMRDTQEALQAAQTQLASIIRVAPMLLTAIDAEGIVRFADGSGFEQVSVRPADLVGRPAVEFLADDASRRALGRALAGESATATVGTSTGGRFDVTWQPVVAGDGTVSGVVAVALDVTARHASEAHLRHLAHHDALTGAPNRARLEQEIAAHAGGELAAIAVDVDGFKTVNDSLGHAAGDDVLRELAGRLRAVAQQHGAFLARPGADEFTLLIAATPHGCLRDDAERLVQAALAAVHEPIAASGSEFVVSATTGVAVGTAESGELLRHADVALGAAKQRGLPLAWYEGEQGDPRGRLTLTARIRAALANGEFELYYQPVLDLESDRISGMEALIRWNDPQRGVVAPDEFIPAAEASGLINDVGRWVADEVCRQWRAWADEGMDVAIGFNVAPRELRREDFASTLLQAARRHGADPRRLIVEITERAAMREPERTDAVLRELKAAGLRIAIDDFGADHSSLSRLRGLEVDILKIDRSFLAGVPGERDAAAIVSAIISLACALGMHAVAEGVERTEQLDFLRGKQCRRVQGYHIARPMPAAQAAAYVRAGGPALPARVPEAA